MRSVARILVAAALFAAMLQPAIPADERIEGVVRDTVVTHCDATRRGGCAGTLTLERRAGGKIETLTINVPLGTPISRGAERALLHTLEGERVIVTQITDRGSRIARAIELAESPRAGPASGSSSPDIC